MMGRRIKALRDGYGKSEFEDEEDEVEIGGGTVGLTFVSFFVGGVGDVVTT